MTFAWATNATSSTSFAWVNTFVRPPGMLGSFGSHVSSSSMKVSPALMRPGCETPFPRAKVAQQRSRVVMERSMGICKGRGLCSGQAMRVRNGQ